MNESRPRHRGESICSDTYRGPDTPENLLGLADGYQTSECGDTYRAPECGDTYRGRTTSKSVTCPRTPSSTYLGADTGSGRGSSRRFGHPVCPWLPIEYGAGCL